MRYRRRGRHPLAHLGAGAVAHYYTATFAGAADAPHLQLRPSGEAAAPAAAAPTKVEEMQAAAEAEKEKEKGQPTIFYHSQDFKEAGGASLNVGDEVEFYAFVDKVKGEAVARKLKRTKEAEVKAAPRGEWKKRDERAHSKFAKGPDGTKGFAEGSRPLAAAASLVAALAIAG